MTNAQILGYPLLPIAALDLLLALLLIKQNPRRSRVNWATAVCALAASIWSLSTALMYIRSDLGLDYMLFARLSWIGWFTVPSALQSALYLENEQSRMARIAGWGFYPFWAVVLLLCLSTNLVVTDGYVPIPYRNSPGPLEMPLRLIGGVTVIWLIYELLSVRRRTVGTRRAQLGWYLYGTVFFGIGGMLIGGFLQLFTGRGLEPSLSAYFSFPWVLLIFYAITRYRLFDIRLVLSRIAGALLLSVVIAVIQFGLAKLLEPSFGEFTTIVISITVIGLALFGTPLGRNVQRRIDYLLLRERHAYRQILRRSAQAMITILRLDDLLQFIVSAVREGMGPSYVNLYLTEPGIGESHCCYTTDSRRAKNAVPRDILIPQVRAGHPAVLADLESRGGAELVSAAAYMREEQVELVVPLILQTRLLGLLVLGERETGDPYVESDVDLLEALASQASVAIDNARLFEEAARIRESLQKSEEKFRILANTLTAAVVIHAGGKLLYTNPATSFLTGYSLEELSNMDFWSIIHPAYVELVTQRARARLHGETAPQQYEFKVVRKDGTERWALTNTGMLDFEGKKSVIATLLDITDRKVAEAEKERLYEESASHYRSRIEEQQLHQEEKEKIVKDLHDGIGGLTTNINLLAELARQNDDNAQIRKALRTISDLSRESLAEIRTFMQSLDTRELDWPTIAAELRHLGNTIIEPHGVRFSLETAIESGCNAPTSVITLNLFRIYKESLANIIKHSRAKSVDVLFAVEAAKLTMSISDDGIGLNAKRKDGRGLHNMQARAAELGGTLSLSSEKGTRVVLEIPIP